MKNITIFFIAATIVEISLVIRVQPLPSRRNLGKGVDSIDRSMESCGDGESTAELSSGPLTLSISEWLKNETDDGSKKPILHAERPKVCRNCGVYNKIDQRYCTDCYKPVDKHVGIVIKPKSNKSPVPKIDGVVRPKACPHCGVRNKIDQKFCTNCNKLVDIVSKKDRPIKCIHCGERNKLDEKYCSTCRLPVDRAPNSQP